MIGGGDLGQPLPDHQPTALAGRRRH
jgi:hypothetical protein